MTRTCQDREEKTMTNLASEPGYSLPFVFRAIVLGLEISRKIPAEKFNKYVYVILHVVETIIRTSIIL